jgi:hypothetical protein
MDKVVDESYDIVGSQYGPDVPAQASVSQCVPIT